MKINTGFKNTRQWINTKIQRKLIFWTIGFWIISLTILSLSIFFIGQTEILNETRQRNVQLASVVGRDVNSQVSNILADIRIFSHHLEVSESDITSQAAALLAFRLSSPQRYSGVYYFNSAGQLQIYINDPLERLVSLRSVELVTRTAITVDNDIMNTLRMTKGINTYVSDVRFNGIDDIPVMYVGLPINLGGNESKVLVFEVDLRDIWQRIDLSTTGQTGFTYAVSRNGTIIAYPQPASIGRQIPSEIQPLLQGFEGFTEYIEPSNNRKVIAAYSPVGGGTGWGIVVVQDKSEANIPVIRTGLFIIGIWLGLAIFGTLGILILIKNFTRPIVNLTRTSQAIAQTGDLTRATTVHRPDEVGQLSQAFDQMIERLQNSEVKLVHVAAEERNRLARDLHDAVSQTLFSASLIAEVLPRLWERNQDEGLKRLEEVRQLTRGALAEMRTLLLELRPSSLAEAEIGLLLHQLAESITGRSRIPVKVSIEGDCPLPVEVKIALYRIAQESLNNVAKHSGASEAQVELVCRPEQVLLKVTDNGKGFDVVNSSTKSLGMGIIRERAREIGASLSIQSNKDDGTEISVVWDPQINSPSQS